MTARVDGSVRVLVVGDPTAVRGIIAALDEHLCVVDFVDDAKLVSDRCDELWPDAVVLDVPSKTRTVSLDALDWLRRFANLPVVVMTEPADVDARLRAVALGADDTVVPTDPREVVGRVAMLVRRRRMSPQKTHPLGDLSIDRAGRRIVRRGNAVAITHRELEVLDVLVERPGRVVPKEELLERVWSGKGRSANAVEAQISALRRKLHDLGPPVIHTAHGEGYVFRPVVAERPERGNLIAERERLVREREEAVHRRAKLLRQLEEQFAHRNATLRNDLSKAGRDERRASSERARESRDPRGEGA